MALVLKLEKWIRDGAESLVRKIRSDGAGSSGENQLEMALDLQIGKSIRDSAGSTDWKSIKDGAGSVDAKINQRWRWFYIQLRKSIRDGAGSTDGKLNQKLSWFYSRENQLEMALVLRTRVW